MRGDGLAGATRTLVFSVAALYAVACAAGLAFIDFDTTTELVVWLTFLLGGAALMVLGQVVVPPSWPSAIAVSLGAVIGGLPLVWTILVPVVVAVIITCTFALARRPATA